ncbi:hypothetical protein KQI65_15650 [bacterium]|nr:hypothetical protein [bacterium]
MRYTDLCSIEILHDYHADGRARDCMLFPTAECLARLAGSGLLTKQHGNIFYVLAPTEDDSFPFLPIPSNIDFTFRLQTLASRFYAMSNLPLDPRGRKRYLFGNRLGTELGGKAYLHPSQPLFNAASDYPVGSFVRDGADLCYESLVDLSASTPQNQLSETGSWREVGTVCYAVEENQCLFTGPEFLVDVQPAADVVTVELFALDAGTGLYDRSVFLESTRHEAPVSRQRVSLQHVPEGVYRISVNAVEEMICLRPDDDWYDAIGFVRIAEGDAIPSTHRLLHNDGTFAHPRFTIRIAPLSVLWQYRAKTERVKNVLDSSGSISFTSPESGIFRSTLPQPLRETAYGSIVIEFNDTNPVDPLKTIQIENMEVPGLRDRGSAMQNGTSYITSQVTLNY